MKTCEQCGAEFPEEEQVCPQCGKAQTEAEPAENVTEAEPAELEETVETEPAAEAPVEQPKKKSVAAWVVLAVIAVIAVAAVLIAGGRKTAEKPSAAPSATTEQLSGVAHVNAYGLNSYSVHYETAEDGTVSYWYLNEDGQQVNVTAETAEQAANAVAVSCGDLQLTNVELGYYYDQQMYNLLSTYGEQISYLMDFSMPMDEQLSPDGTQSWMNYMLNASMLHFHQIAALCVEAEKNGFALPQEELDNLDSTMAQMEDMAVQNGYEDALAYLRSFYGPFASLESYREFLKRNMLASAYLSELQEQVVMDEDKLQEVYANNVDTFESYHIPQVDKNVIHVRHILITPEDTANEESWAAAKAEAERIYEEWKAGEATEDSFAEFAGQYSTDPGSAQNGGLYEEVAPGQMVDPFNDWCFADGRAVGDTGIVETNYGYHIMYFVGEGDYIYWKLAAEQIGRQDEGMKLLDAMMEANALTTAESNLAFFDPAVPTVPAEPEESAESTEPAEKAE